MSVLNAFSIDTEDWFHANYEDGLFDNSSVKVSTVEENVDRYLKIFDEASVKATFFILGVVVEQHPQMVKKIHEAGHEIASHGYGHQLVYSQSPEEFREDVKKSKVLLEDLVGEKVYGYRAPSWSITENSLWALDILEELGFEYQSSIFPTKNFLYGIPYAPRRIHDCSIYGKPGLKIRSVPPSTLAIGKMNIPFSGGAYYRLLPYETIKAFAKYLNEKENMPAIFYLHPREIDVHQPRLKLKPKDHMIHYYGIRYTERKLIKTVKDFEFTTINELLKRF